MRLQSRWGELSVSAVYEHLIMWLATARTDTDGTRSSSPWSNEYDPPLEDGTVPTPKLRKLEIVANETFDTYREMYVTYVLARALSSLLRLHSGTMKEAYRQFSCGISKTVDLLA